MGHAYDWMLHEPGAWETEYQGTEHSVEFTLAPVSSWEERLRLEMTYDMEPEMLWRDFIRLPSLIAQLNHLATRSPSPKDYGTRDRYEREHPYLLCNSALTEEALDWIWETYRVRLGNRAHAAACEEGSVGLDRLCRAITSRFDFRSRVGELPADVPSADPLAFLDRLAQATNHELYLVFTIDGWNGWERHAWLRFVGEVDKAKKMCAETARAADGRRSQREGVRSDRPPLGSASTGAASITPARGSYIADEYAENLRAAFSADPDRFRRHGRYAFKALRKAAELRESQERTVKQWLGYEGEAGGFEEFLSRLYGVVGQKPPE